MPLYQCFPNKIICVNPIGESHCEYELEKYVGHNIPVLKTLIPGWLTYYLSRRIALRKKFTASLNQSV